MIQVANVVRAKECGPVHVRRGRVVAGAHFGNQQVVRRLQAGIGRLIPIHRELLVDNRPDEQLCGTSTVRSRSGILQGPGDPVGGVGVAGRG